MREAKSVDELRKLDGIEDAEKLENTITDYG